MTRLFRFAQWVLLLAVALVPVVECFDFWDPPGPGGDTDIPLFTVLLAICLVLVVCRMVALLCCAVRLREHGRTTAGRGRPLRSSSAAHGTGLLPPILTPLRI